MCGCVYFFFYVWRRPTDKNCVKKCQKEYDIISIGLSPDQSTPKLWLKWRYKSQGLSLNFCNMVAFAYLSICMLFSPIFFPSSSVCMRVCLNAAGAHFSQHSIEPLCLAYWILLLSVMFPVPYPERVVYVCVCVCVCVYVCVCVRACVRACYSLTLVFYNYHSNFPCCFDWRKQHVYVCKSTCTRGWNHSHMSA